MVSRRVSPRGLAIYGTVIVAIVAGGLISGMSTVAIACLLIFATSIYLIASEIFIRSTAALLGALLVFIVFLLEGSHTPVEIAHHYIEMNTILTLFGIIIVASLGLKSGLFYFLGMKVAKASRGDPLMLYVILAIFTFVLNIFLIAVATIVVVVSLTLAICDILKIDPRPYVIMEIFVVNVAASATMISAVPNIIVAEKANLSFSFFVINILPFTALFFVVSIWMLFRTFHPPTVVDPRRAMAILEIDEWLFVKNRGEFYASAVSICGLIVGFIASRELMVVSLLFATIALALYSKPEELIRDVDWDTLLFFIGFYVIIAGLSITGVLTEIADVLVEISRGNPYILVTLLFWISIFVSGFVDNIPYVLVIIPIIEILISEGGFSEYAGVLWITLILACNIGGGLNPYSAPQNLLAMSLAKRARYPIMSKDFYRVSVKWTICGGVLAYAYAMMLMSAPIIMFLIGRTTFLLLIMITICAGTVVGIHRTIGLRRFARYIRLFVERASSSAKRYGRSVIRRAR